MSNSKFKQEQVINALENLGDHMNRVIEMLFTHQDHIEDMEGKTDFLGQAIETVDAWADEIRLEQRGEE